MANVAEPLPQTFNISSVQYLNLENCEAQRFSTTVFPASQAQGCRTQTDDVD